MKLLLSFLLTLSLWVTPSPQSVHMTEEKFDMAKTVMGWDDIAEYGIDSEKAQVHWWKTRRPQDLERDIEKGFSTIICPENPFYLDYCQDTRHKYGFKSRRYGWIYNHLDSMGIYYYDIHDHDAHPEPAYPHQAK